MLNFGERLKRARERKGLTQAQVMRLTNVSDKSLSRYETNASAPDPDTIQELILLYDVSSDYLFGLTEEMGHAAPRGSSETPPSLLSAKTMAAIEKLSPEARAKAEDYIAMLQTLEEVNNGSGAKSFPFRWKA